MKRLFTLVAAVVLTGNLLSAQSVDQGKKFYYYERYKSAKETFDKVLAANPNNLEAVYWLGQTLIEMKDSLAAKDLYSKVLQQNGSAPLVLVGMGQVELMEGKTADARQRFETALSLTKSKDVDVINAIGAANVRARLGDATYAIEKLNLAPQIKGFKSPETYVILGNAYRKSIDGGNAVTSFTKALTFDPKIAAAKHNIGKVYLTQNNKDYFIPAFEEAVQLDPNYAPSWYELFFYYYYRDVNKAAEYFDKYLAVSDASPNNEYDRISIIYARKMYTEAIAAAQQKITAEADKADPRYYKLIAYSYDESKDSANAKTYMDQYFAKQKPEGVLPKDYSFYAKLLGQFSQYDDAYKNYRLAIAADTSMEAKVDLLKEASALAKKSGNRAEEANWLGEAYKMKPNPNQNDLYNWGLAHYQSANYVTADSIFCGLYQTAYPNEIFGYLWCARAKEGQDTTWASGIAEAPYQMLADKAITIDSTKYKRIAIDARFKLVVFYNDVKKDKDAAIRELDKILSMDAANADATRIRDILNKPAPKTAPPARPRTGTTKPPTPPKPPVKNGNR